MVDLIKSLFESFLEYPIFLHSVCDLFLVEVRIDLEGFEHFSDMLVVTTPLTKEKFTVEQSLFQQLQREFFLLKLFSQLISLDVKSLLNILFLLLYVGLHLNSEKSLGAQFIFVSLESLVSILELLNLFLQVIESHLKRVIKIRTSIDE